MGRTASLPNSLARNRLTLAWGDTVELDRREERPARGPTVIIKQTLLRLGQIRAGTESQGRGAVRRSLSDMRELPIRLDRLGSRGALSVQREIWG